MGVKIHILLLILIVPLGISAQERVNLKNSDILKGKTSTSGERYNELRGNVHLTQGDTRIFCNSANFYRASNRFEAFGNVRIYDGDSVIITSEKAFYDGKSDLLQLREKVVFRRLGEMTVYTDNLDYNETTRNAKYFKGGRLVDEGNDLKSERGYLDNINGLASFKGDVVVNNEGSILESDTLQYDLNSKVIYFLAQTKLVDNEGNISNYKSGKYNTITKTSTLRGGRIQSGSYYLEADTIFLDELKKIYHANGQVYMKSDSDNVVITGEKAVYNKDSGLTKVFENAVMRKPTEEGDTLYIAADTLMSLDTGEEKDKRLLAYRNVRIFKEDIQGKADSLAYINNDSIIYFYRDPVLWASGSQISADTLGLKLVNNQLEQLQMFTHGFIISQDTIKNFNQIKGRHITTYFSNNDIVRIEVKGNAESLYHVLKDDQSGIQGVNKITSSNIRILFSENEVNKIKTYVDVDSYFIPPHELKPDQKQLQDFKWRENERPLLPDVLEKVSVLDSENVPNVKIN